MSFYVSAVLVRIFSCLGGQNDELQPAQRPKINHSKSKLAEAKTVMTHSLQAKHHFLHWRKCFEHLSQHRQWANSEHLFHQKLTCGSV